MRLIYRGDQERVISELASYLEETPTNMMYKLAEQLHSKLIKPIDALDAQENLNDRDQKERKDVKNKG